MLKSYSVFFYCCPLKITYFVWKFENLFVNFVFGEIIVLGCVDYDWNQQLPSILPWGLSGCIFCVFFVLIFLSCISFFTNWAWVRCVWKQHGQASKCHLPVFLGLFLYLFVCISSCLYFVFLYFIFYIFDKTSWVW